MPHLYLIRHAMTQPDDGDAAGWPLSPLGEQEAERLADHPCWQQITRVVSSPEEKAVATVRPAIARYGLPLVTDPGLRELKRPLLWTSQDVYEQTVRSVFATPEVSVADWEPAGVVRAHIAAAVDALLQTYPDDTLALVSHGLALSLWLAHLRGDLHASFDEWCAIPFAAVAVVDLDRRAIVAPFAPL